MAERIDPAERSGVLEPANLVRFAATWHAPDARLADVVETYWHVSWSLGDEAIAQRIVEAPAVTLSIEHGDVPWPLVRTTPGPRAWTRTIRGTGEVLGIRLRPAGLAVVSDQPIGAAGTAPVDAATDARLHGLLTSIAAARTLDDRIRLQEAARMLAAPDATPAAVAGALGYADQAHLTNDLRSVADVTPAAYVRSLRALAG